MTAAANGGRRGSAVISGASRGIGRACALRLAADGHDIAIGYLVNAERAEAVADEVRSLGRRAITVRGDVRSEGTGRDIVHRADAELGSVRVVVANATGIPSDCDPHPPADPQPRRLGATLDVDFVVYASMLDARLRSLHELARAAVPLMAPDGRIVALTSTGSRRHVPGYAPIAAAMAAVECLVRYLAVELGPRGITANAVCGGVVDTDALHLLTDDVARLRDRAGRVTPLGRIATPDDIADVVSMLAGDAGRWITGQAVVVDGGALVR